jgi:hypothetical protein
MLQPKKPVVKKTTKKSNNPADSYPANKDNRGVPTIGGGEGKRPPFDKNSPVLPLPGRKAKNMPKAKNGKSFPDLNKDGKITKADVLKGRGVIAKKGATIKKAQMGSKVGNYAPTKENIDKGFSNKSIKSEDKDYKVKVKLKDDGSVKATERRTLKGFLTGAPKAGGKLMKSGGSMKKCKGGC